MVLCHLNLLFDIDFVSGMVCIVVGFGGLEVGRILCACVEECSERMGRRLRNMPIFSDLRARWKQRNLT